MPLFLRILLGVVVVVALLVTGLYWRARHELMQDIAYHKALPRTLAMTSTSFADGNYIPIECTCKAGDISPGILFDNEIPGAKSFALTMIDPDVPSSAFPLFNMTHWVIYNLNPATSRIWAGSGADSLARHGGAFGKNSMGDLKYIGPCPPMGRHLYLFRVYALDTTLKFEETPNKAQLMTAMTGHVLAYGQLAGYFSAK